MANIEVASDVYGLADGRPDQLRQTPLIELDGLTSRGTVSIKAEYMNRLGSIKDRAAHYMLDAAVREHGQDVTVVESTSGNLGCALAYMARERGVRFVALMDVSSPTERIERVKSAGAEMIVVVEPRPGLNLRQTRIAMAEEMSREPGNYWLDQYSNEANVQCHYEITGPEIWSSTGGRVDAVVMSVGSGGTIAGVGKFLETVAAPPLIVGVEPLGSTIFGGEDLPYLTAGAGMRGPSALIDRHRHVIDLAAQVPDETAAVMCREVHRRHGIEVGLTSGAALVIAAQLAEERELHAVAVACDLAREFAPVIESLAATQSAYRVSSLPLLDVSASTSKKVRQRDG